METRQAGGERFVRLSEREARKDRVRKALAEAGYPDARVRWDERRGGCVSVVTHLNGVSLVPEAATFRAFAICGEPGLACWPCWVADTKETCDHDPMTSPWPPSNPEGRGR